jgi:maleylpyruvate isomerase
MDDVATASLQEASRRLVRTVDGLSDTQLAAPSLLPGWSRAHVVAHLALNAEALDAVVRGLLAEEPVPMYASPEARDRDIEELAGESSSELRARLLAGTAELAEALAALPEDQRDAVVERTPGSDRTFLAGEVGVMRLREVEIHHADLDAGYTRADWPEAFAGLLVEQLAGRAGATLEDTDSDRTWPGPVGTPTVAGTLPDLGWWLSGRGDGEGLTARDGALPTVAAW